MCGFVTGVHLAAISSFAMEDGYRRLCEAEKAEGRDPPSRESYFGTPLKWHEDGFMKNEPSFKSSDWWPLWLVAIFG